MARSSRRQPALGGKASIAALTLLMIALIGVVLVSAVVGTRNPRGRWTSIRQRLSMSRHAAMGGGDPIGVGNWENEGGSSAGVDDDLPVTIDLQDSPHH